MAFVDLYSELTGSVPKLPVNFAKTLINRAWRDVRRANLWSFLLFEANWTSPALVSAGTVTVTQGSNSIVFDATAATAINAIQFGPPSTITQRQFRIGIGTIYNIWTWDGVNTATLDRNYNEPTASGQKYVISQLYYAAPFKDFLDFIVVRDITNFNDLITTKTREWLDMVDPQRTIYYLPTHVVFYQQDQNPQSATYQWPLYELWGNPQYVLTYQIAGMRKGTDMVNATDDLPPAVGADVVMAKARQYAYEWAEANKGDSNQRSDYRFLMGAADATYQKLVREYRRQDRNTVDLWAGQRRVSQSWPNLWGFYNSISTRANPGAPW